MRWLAVSLLLALPACAKNEEARSRAAPAASPAPVTSGTPVPSSASTTAAPVTASEIASPTLTETTLHFQTSLGPTDVVVLVPMGATKAAPLPVLVAFHGRGESLKGFKRGARGWIDDYALGTAVARLAVPPLTAKDFGGFVTDTRLKRLNDAIAERPYRGLIVVCPYLPDVLRANRALEQGRELARFVADELLPKVYRDMPAVGTARTTSVDGVSLGGRASLLVGLLRPDAFGTVAALQPALDNEEAGFFADLAQKARARNDALRLRILTSDGDYFLEPVTLFDHALTSRAVPHQLDVVTGPHSYEFNRGPGVYEMLLFHDRALRGDPSF